MGRERISQKMLQDARELTFSAPLGERHQSALFPFRPEKHTTVTETTLDRTVLYRRRETTRTSRLGRLATPPATRIEVAEFTAGDDSMPSILRYFDLYYQERELVGSLAIAAKRRSLSDFGGHDSFVLMHDSLPSNHIYDAVAVMPGDFALPTPQP